MVRRPVEGEVYVHYAQLYVESDPDGFGPDLAEAFAGQTAGLCGAAVPGALWLTTGLHTGRVGFTVEVHDQVPPLDPVWEDVVEVSFQPVSERSVLMQWASEAVWELDLLEAPYRVRYCAQGMDRGNEKDTRSAEEPLVDRYVLQLWPALPAPDRVMKQSSAVAAHSHDYARRQPPAPTPAERAEAERLARVAQEQAALEQRLAFERWEWGGQLPSQELRRVGGNVRGLLPFDAALVHTLAAAGPELQRAVALLAARRACTAAGLADLDRIAAALTALAERRPLPPPFDEPADLWEILRSDPRVPQRSVGRAVAPDRAPFRSSAPAGVQALGPTAQHAPGTATTGPAAAAARAARAREPAHEPSRPPAGDASPPAGEASPPAGDASPPTGEAAPYTVRIILGEPDPSLRISQPHMALPAVTGAAETDPLRAALDAVYAAVATYGEDYPALLDEIRAVCKGA